MSFFPQISISILEQKEDYKSFMAFSKCSMTEAVNQLCSIGFLSGDARRIYSRIFDLQNLNQLNGKWNLIPRQPTMYEKRDHDEEISSLNSAKRLRVPSSQNSEPQNVNT